MTDAWQTLPRCAVMVGDNVPYLGIVTGQSFSIDMRAVKWRFGEEHHKPYHGIELADGTPVEAYTISWDVSTDWMDAFELLEIYGPVRDDRYLGVE